MQTIASVGKASDNGQPVAQLTFRDRLRLRDVPFVAVVEGGLSAFLLYALLFVAGSLATAVIAIVYAFYRIRGVERSIALIVLYGAWQVLDTQTFSGVSFQQSVLTEGLSGTGRALFLLALVASILPLRRQGSGISAWLISWAFLCVLSASHLFLMDALVATTMGRLMSAAILMAVGMTVTAKYEALIPERAARRFNLTGFVFGLLTSLMLMGIVLFVVGAGNRVNGDFQGAVIHPQSWGLIGGTLAILAFAFGRRFTIAYVVALLAIITTFLSGTRTAVLALILGIGLDMMVAALPKHRAAGSFAVLVAVLGSAAVSLLLLAVFATGSIVSVTDALLSAYIEARGVLFYESAFNFALHPWLGIGFGVPSDIRLLNPEFLAQSISTFGATGEKGSSYIALFEENGLLLGFPWLALLTIMLVRAARDSILVGSILYLVVVSHGEAVLLSLSGPASLIWGTIFAGALEVRRARTSLSRPYER